MTVPEVAAVRFDEHGLVPVVVQDAANGDVLMLAFMNEEALRLTRETGRAHYWSRGRSKLWRKGETSGNEQRVISMRINCEQNSLLLEVEQTGAVCHDGYNTCFYRTLGDDGVLTVVRDRVFDPVAIYGLDAGAAATPDPLTEATRLQYGAYEFLRDQDHEAQSTTSRRLRDPHRGQGARIADELEELAGVLTGTHGHADPTSDLLVEASQVVYWVLLEVVQAGAAWGHLRPDRALTTDEAGPARETIVQMLRAQARHWQRGASGRQAVTADAHATLALVGQACRVGGVEPLAVIDSDLAELRGRAYLEPYFARQAA